MKYLYAMLGAPGVGKTTFLEEVSKEIFNDLNLLDYVIGPDDIRRMVSSPDLKPDGKYQINQKNEGFIWEFIREILDKKVQNGELIIVDATHSRNKAISAYKKYSDQGYRVTLIDFSDVPLETIKERNAQREPIKFVPESVIETLYERIKSLDIPTWVEVIKPDQFKDHFQNNVFNFDEFNALTFIGDVHSCADELHAVLDAYHIDPDIKDKSEAIISVGDLFDRGPKPVETFRIAQKLFKNKAFWLLMGNHEEPLRYHKEFYKDVFEKFQLWVKEFILVKEKHLFSELWDTEVEPEAKTIYQNAIGRSYRQFDEIIEELKKYPKAFSAFKGFVWGYKLSPELKKVPNGYQKIRGTSVGTMKQFLLSDIKYTEVLELVKRAGQVFHGDFHGIRFLATHAGLPTLPDKRTPTSIMIRGVGGYGDAKECMETFERNHRTAIQIHGHRNMEDLPVQVTPNTFNINGDVDQGLRSVKFIKGESLENWIVEVAPTKETEKFYREKQLEKAKKFNAKKLSIEDESKGIMQLFQNHRYIDIKKLPEDIVAINFTKKAFEHRVWDDITVKARGLFMAMDPDEELPKDYVIARGYQKFFNLNESHGFSERDIRQLAYPLYVYEKANGYLGILSVDQRDPENLKWFIASKSTNQGDYAEVFRKMITPFLTQELMEKMIQDNTTLVFEVIEPKFDPHIEEYTKPELVLLDAIVNKIDFEKKSYQETLEYLKCFKESKTIRAKVLIKKCNTFNDWYKLNKQANAVEVFTPYFTEGFVIEDSLEGHPNMFKVKTTWYNFWKRQRGLMQRLSRILKNSPDHDISKSDLVRIKAQLHTVEEIKVMNFMVDYLKANLSRLGDISIIEIRNEFLKE